MKLSVIIILSIMLLVGCGSDDDNDSRIEYLEGRISELQSEINDVLKPLEQPPDLEIEIMALQDEILELQLQIRECNDQLGTN